MRARVRVVLTGPPRGASEEHPGLSGPGLQMSSPGTGRLGRHYHSSPHSLTFIFFLGISRGEDAGAKIGKEERKKKKRERRRERGRGSGGPGCPALCNVEQK